MHTAPSEPWGSDLIFKDFLKPLIQAAVQETLEAEMAQTLGAENGELTDARLGDSFRASTGTRRSPGWQGRAEGAAGPLGAVLDRAVRAPTTVATYLMLLLWLSRVQWRRGFATCGGSAPRCRSRT